MEVAEVGLRVSREIFSQTMYQSVLQSSQGWSEMVAFVSSLTCVLARQHVPTGLFTREWIVLPPGRVSLRLFTTRQLTSSRRKKGEVGGRGDPKMETIVFYNLSSKVIYYHESVHYIYSSTSTYYWTCRSTWVQCGRKLHKIMNSKHCGSWAILKDVYYKIYSKICFIYFWN